MKHVSCMQWDRGGLSVTERLDGACFLYAVGLELSLYSC